MSYLNSSNGPPFPTQTLDTFSATRGCGSTVPDRCRERARTALSQCFSTAIANPSTQPPECITNGVTGYDVGVLNTTMQRKLCTEPRWRNTAFDVRLTMRTTGGDACLGTFITPNIVRVNTATCPQGN